MPDPAFNQGEIGAALVNRYTVERELGRGGMATVYLARDLKLQRQVALKVLRPELGAAVGSNRFLREIAIAARLSHPHILALHDSGEAGGKFFYAMPFVEGESLRQRLEREGQLPVQDTIEIVKAVSSALSYAHQQGVIHRDIKPENILLARNAEAGTVHPLVADFGIARALDVAGGERLTETGLALGTPAYMSPEQAAAGRVDGRSDIYALGCVAYEMLAGSPPFTGPTAQAILARHAVDPVPPLHTVRATISPAVESAVERALAKVPADRFATADEFAQALESESPIRLPRWRTFSRSRRSIAAGVLVGAAAVGLGVWFVSTSARAAVLPSASKMAVLPLLSLGPDTSLTRLGKDLANTISASLAGVGGIQLTDRLSIETSTAGKDLSPADGAALARRLGATSFVQGTLVGAGDQVRLDLGLYGTDRLEPLARSVTVTAHRDSIRLLTDSASFGLLRQVWQRGEPPTPSLAAVTTLSLPALRAFLDGERQLAGGRWEDAQLAYAAATDADSAFGLAWWRYAFAKWWIQEETDSALLSVARRHSSELPEKERLLATLWAEKLEHQTGELIDQARVLTERFPDYWPAWFEYGDQLFHYGPALGHEHREAMQAFERALDLNPRLVPAWHHLQDAAGLAGDTAIVAKTLVQLDSLEPLDPGAPPRDHRRLLRWGIRLLRGQPFVGPAADSLVADIASVQDVEQQTWVTIQFSAFAGPRAQIELSRRVIARTPWRSSAEIHRRVSALSWAARGAWDSALATIDDYANHASDLAGLTSGQAGAIGGGADLANLDRYRMAVIGSWLGGLDGSTAKARREAAAQAVMRNGSQQRRLEFYWLDGLLSASQNDLAGLRQARKLLVGSDTVMIQLTVRALNAFELKLIGRGTEAADSMAAVAWSRGWVGASWGIVRLAAARWLASEGDLDQAARLLPWWETMISDPDFVYGSGVLEGPSRLETATVEAARGNGDLAQENYRRFLWLCDLPSPRIRPVVEQARAALRTLD